MMQPSETVEMQEMAQPAAPPPQSQQRDVEARFQSPSQEPRERGCTELFCIAMSYILIFLTFPVSVCMCIKIVQEYQRAVVFRLGRLIPEVKGPGIFFIIPCIDQFLNIDLRVVSYNVPSQEILSRDSVTVSVDAVVYFKVFDPITSVVGVENATESTKLLAQTTLRTILGTHTLSEILSDREKISADMKISLDEATEPWGIKVERVELRDVRLPSQMQRAMAAEAEATRDAGAKIIAAEGELRASAALAEAATVISQSEGAMQLRYLHTLNAISSEKTSTIIFPFPMEMLAGIKQSANNGQQNFPVQEMVQAALQSIHRQDTIPATASSGGSRL
ncbi:CRE-STO-1 protein [Caenorhabditis remanei]|uniref:CRE-STO-1 protein n=1 Tax=Caenorhabditis remanei TaxID=31234 RepID=E3LCM9_CAERE|nr:CRE-STO-1 protein [Caenorhabditis remanei]